MLRRALLSFQRIAAGVIVARTKKNAKPKKVKRRSWSVPDLREFKKLARAKTSAEKLAKHFKRTVGAIRQKALHLGVSLDTRR